MGSIQLTFALKLPSGAALRPTMHDTERPAYGGQNPFTHNWEYSHNILEK